jgi:hypothetical protein
MIADETCSWLGIPVAVAYHLLTIFILLIVIAAEYRLWFRHLHASSTAVIGLIQLWAGLAALSRA